MTILETWIFKNFWGSPDPCRKLAPSTLVVSTPFWKSWIHPWLNELHCIVHVCKLPKKTLLNLDSKKYFSWEKLTTTLFVVNFYLNFIYTYMYAWVEELSKLLHKAASSTVSSPCMCSSIFMRIERKTSATLYNHVGLTFFVLWDKVLTWSVRYDTLGYQDNSNLLIYTVNYKCFCSWGGRCTCTEELTCLRDERFPNLKRFLG